MKKSIIIIATSIASICGVAIIALAGYWKGYCDASDNYINATECKPIRKLHVFPILFRR